MSDEPRAVSEPQWDAADVIVGNPPFLGSFKLRSELGDEYVEALFKLYSDRLPVSDLCCYWFEKARAMIVEGKVKRVGLLATQAIRGGANRTVLERIKQGGNIFWAQSDRKWIQDGVAVHVSMIGFDNGVEKSCFLDNYPVKNINPDLTSLSDLTQAHALQENLMICFRPDEKGGPFDIDASTARNMLSAPLNPNRRSNSDVVRPYVNGRDITQRSENKWVIDFGDAMSKEEAALYELPFEYVKRVVKPVRDKSRNAREKEIWWIHRRPAPDMRKAVKNLSRYVVTPRVTKHRLFVWLDSKTIPDSATYAFAREDDYFFGVLHSKVHELWARATGTQLREAESGFRYTPTSTFETFPFPRPNAKQKEAIALAAKELNEKREHWLNPYKDEPSAIHEDLKKRTLTNLYNEMPTWLQLAHEKLDHAVLDAYGWAHDISDDDILAKLLAENLKREAVQGRGAQEDDEEKPKKREGKRKK